LSLGIDFLNAREELTLWFISQILLRRRSNRRRILRLMKLPLIWFAYIYPRQTTDGKARRTPIANLELRDYHSQHVIMNHRSRSTNGPNSASICDFVANQGANRWARASPIFLRDSWPIADLAANFAGNRSTHRQSMRFA
jgi:hypothetical protein